MSRKDWTPAEEREIRRILDRAGIVRTGQLVAAGYGIWALFTGEWSRALFCFGVAAFLNLFLPYRDPKWEDRAREIEENSLEDDGPR